MGHAHTLSGLYDRMNGASVECMGQAIHSMAYRGTWERARILDYMIQYMNHMIIESLAIFIFFACMGTKW